MVKIYVDKATKDLRDNFSQLSKGDVAKATSNAINRSLMKGRTVARTEVKNVYNIPQKNLDGINKKNATKSHLVGYIMASAKPIPADAFSPKFATTSSSISISKKGVQKTTDFKRSKKSAAKGVSIEVHKGDRQVIPFAFMIRNAKPRVFARGKYRTGGGVFGFVQRNERINKSGSDLPIKPLISVTVHGAVINETVEDKIGRELQVYYPKRLAHELNFLLSKMKRGKL